MFLPHQAPPVIRRRSAGTFARATDQVRPSAALDKTKYKFECRKTDIEVEAVDGTVSTDTQEVLAVNIPGSTAGWELIGFPCKTT